MALPSSPNSISFSQIETEFGQNSGRTLGDYRISQNVGDMSSLPLDTGIPQGNSQISFSDFRGKRLNLVVHYNTSSNGGTNAKSKYDNNNNIVVIGGFKNNRPSNSGGSKVIIHVSDILGGVRNGGRNKAALRTGTGWGTDTDLQIHIGNEGGVSGGGGNGGERGSQGTNGEDGGDGGTAIGIDYAVTSLTIENGGFVRAGGGGGGGGGGAENDTDGSSGGFGGAGSGIPNGLDGEGTSGGSATNGGNGSSGAEAGSTEGGGGGGGGSPISGNGGEGGNPRGEDGTVNKGGDGGQGATGGGQQVTGAGGEGGDNGYAILEASGELLENITGTYQGTFGTGNVN